MRRGERGAVAQQRGRPVGLRHAGVPGVLRAVEALPGCPRGPGTEALRRALARRRLLLLHGHRVVQVEHEQRRRGRLLPGGEGPRSVGQAQDGEDLSLDLPALVIAQAPVDEAGVHMVVSQPAVRAGQKAQAAPRESEHRAVQRCQRRHRDE